jgi:hypothetical protein
MNSARSGKHASDAVLSPWASENVKVSLAVTLAVRRLADVCRLFASCIGNAGKRRPAKAVNLTNHGN